MVSYSVPSDFCSNTLKKLNEINGLKSKGFISEVYGQVTEGTFIASGRMPSLLPQVTMKQLEVYLESCKKYNIKFNYTLNASCMSNKELIHIKELKQFISELYQMGIRSFTVTLPTLMDTIKSMYDDVEIKASAICEINSPEKASYYKEMGISRIVVEPDITRKFDILEKICKVFGDGVEIIVNNMCLKGCPYKMFHYNFESHGEQMKEHSNYYYHKCSLQKANKAYNYIKLNWIRPEDIYRYSSIGIKSFKIQGRNNKNGDNINKIIQYYLEESFDGNLLDLLTLFTPYNSFQPYIDNKKLDGFLEPFYQNKDFCTGLCDTCLYCMDYAKKSMDVSELKTLNQYATQFYEKVNRLD
ncbi:peptidase U32 [Anaerocolumna cellulosilytica]|uniref:Peptidase U32 n=1 Tax=Anaerocolumna cellulosilytica TaxID=433286 RepID=A0A6S6R3Y1_9FIRM|nr:U32 family peptidase [Anaerocolumna cellulosilytica]MBB5194862.1 collagenase-like PrtC family protease [Anaerocolumna cellulosilytica]BCJ94175.1 peptidase U32 [Anaerocolumna cellulosilytica]